MNEQCMCLEKDTLCTSVAQANSVAFDNINKQFADLCKQPVTRYTVTTFMRSFFLLKFVHVRHESFSKCKLYQALSKVIIDPITDEFTTNLSAAEKKILGCLSTEDKKKIFVSWQIGESAAAIDMVMNIHNNET